MAPVVHSVRKVAPWLTGALANWRPGAVIAALLQVRFLEKPYDPDRLLRVVRAALDD
jgi:hypothetical protein